MYKILVIDFSLCILSNIGLYKIILTGKENLTYLRKKCLWSAQLACCKGCVNDQCYFLKNSFSFFSVECFFFFFFFFFFLSVLLAGDAGCIYLNACAIVLVWVDAWIVFLFPVVMLFSMFDSLCYLIVSSSIQATHKTRCLQLCKSTTNRYMRLNVNVFIVFVYLKFHLIQWHWYVHVI